MFIAFGVSLMLINPQSAKAAGLLPALAALVVVGIFDDICDLQPLTKLFVQSVAAAVLIVPGWQVIDLVANIGGRQLQLGIVSLPLSLLLIVGLINAVNMIDGVDGLAGGVVAVTLFWLAIVANVLGDQADVVKILLLFFAVLGFLLFNLPRPGRGASVFMGDAGSMMLGASIAYFTLVLTARSGLRTETSGNLSLVTVMWLLALPMIDTVSLIVQRLLAGVSPLVADRRHLHHLLLGAGIPPAQVTGLLTAVAALLGAIGFTGFALKIPDHVMALGLLVPIAAHTAFVCCRQGRGVGPVRSASDAAMSR